MWVQFAHPSQAAQRLLALLPQGGGQRVHLIHFSERDHSGRLCVSSARNRSSWKLLTETCFQSIPFYLLGTMLHL